MRKSLLASAMAAGTLLIAIACGSSGTAEPIPDMETPNPLEAQHGSYSPNLDPVYLSDRLNDLTTYNRGFTYFADFSIVRGDQPVGDFTVELAVDAGAPTIMLGDQVQEGRPACGIQPVLNFIHLARSGFYHSSTITPTPDGRAFEFGDRPGLGDAGYFINNPDPCPNALHSEAGVLSHIPGDNYSSITSRFWLLRRPAPELDTFDGAGNQRNCEDPGVTCRSTFGRVIGDGMDVIALLMPGDSIGSVNIRAENPDGSPEELPPNFADALQFVSEFDYSRDYFADFETEVGNFTAELYDSCSEHAVANFVYLAQSGFYNDLTFHHIVEDFLVQGGDPDGAGTGTPGYTYGDRSCSDYTHSAAGTLSIANTGEFTSNGSQFFITLSEQSGGAAADSSARLDTYDSEGNPRDCLSDQVKCHPIIGKILDDGLDVVRSISLASETATVRPNLINRIVIRSIDPNAVQLNYFVDFETESGSFTAELNRECAPEAVDNFVRLAQNGFYDGVDFASAANGLSAAGVNRSMDGLPEGLQSVVLTNYSLENFVNNPCEDNNNDAVGTLSFEILGNNLSANGATLSINSEAASDLNIFDANGERRACETGEVTCNVAFGTIISGYDEAFMPLTEGASLVSVRVRAEDEAGRPEPLSSYVGLIDYMDSFDRTRTYFADFATSKGDFTAELYPECSPVAVANFAYLSDIGFYDGITFHRRIVDPIPFVVQGGDPLGNGTGGPGYTFGDVSCDDYSHTSEGVLSMANTGNFYTNGSQFFIALPGSDIQNLDIYEPSGEIKDCATSGISCHPIFGQVMESGFDVVSMLRVSDTIQSITIRSEG